MDVTSSTDWKSAISAATEKFGRIDILVNNAGTSYVNKPTLDVTEDEFQKVFDVNVKGVYLGCNAWIPQAIERGEGGQDLGWFGTTHRRERSGTYVSQRPFYSQVSLCSSK
jgi:NADP-dependent 3-hydroxy acid dehydrogenase YdfG